MSLERPEQARPPTELGSGPLPANYIIKAHVVAGKNLVAPKDGPLNPYVTFSIAGTKQSFGIGFHEATANPCWDEEVIFDSAGSPCNDLLRIYVRSTPDGVDPGVMIGAAELFVREIPFGLTSTHEIRLFPADAKGKPLARTRQGSTGSIFIKFLVLRPQQHDEGQWQLRLLDLEMVFICATEIPAVAVPVGRKPCAVIVARLENCQNAQRFRSKPAPKSSAPAWRQKRRFALADFKHDVLLVTIIDHDRDTGKERTIGTVRIPARHFRLDQGLKSKKYPIDPAPDVPECGLLEVKGRILRLECPLPQPIKIPAPVHAATSDLARAPAGPQAPGHECRLKWDSSDSACSTNFTGYSERGQSISDGASDGIGHKHAELPVPAARSDVLGLHLLNGKVVGVAGLPHADLEKYLTLELVGRKKVRREKQITDPFIGDQNDSIKLKFDFGEVKKGWTIQIKAWRKRRYGGEDELIGVAGIPVKAIEIDSAEPVPITLYHPVDKAAPRGHVSLVAKHRLY